MNVRLVALTGPGGIGKTRLGLQVAADLSDRFPDGPDGVYYVELASIADPALVAPAIAQTLGLRKGGERSPAEGLLAELREKRLLLLLDNVEQVEGAAPLVADLLAASPGLKVLVTTRIALRLRGEHEYPVPPLALPARTAQDAPLPAAALAQYAALALFVQRALAVRPDLQVTDENAPVVAAVCARLDGLPLAIELAAARTKLLPPQALLDRLTHRLDLLTGGAHDLPTRQQTLRGTIAWSYDLLSPAEQVLFRRLAIFAGGWTLEAAEKVCRAAGPPEADLLESLGSLMDKSLVRQQAPAAQASGAEPRFSMLETIREFGLEQLSASGEAEAVHWTYARYFVDLAEQADPQLNGAQQVVWLARLEQEHDNLHAVLAWARERGEAVLGLRLAGALAQFFWLRGYLTEGRKWLDDLLALPTDPQNRDVQAARARALYGAADLAHEQAQYERAAALAEESVALSRALGDRPETVMALSTLAATSHFLGDQARAVSLYEEGLALSRRLGYTLGIRLALGNLGSLAFDAGDNDRAAVLLEESLDLCRQLGDQAMIADVLSILALIAKRRGDFVRAQALGEEDLAISRALGSPVLTARALLALGWATAEQGDSRRAMALIEECLPLFRAAGNHHQAALALSLLGDIAREQNDLAAAQAHYCESLMLARDLEDRYPIAWALEGLGMLAALQRQLERAARLLSAGQAARERIGTERSTRERQAFERAEQALHVALGDAAFEAAQATGRALSTEQAIAEALGPTV